jgi:hypothetical protein
LALIGGETLGDPEAAFKLAIAIARQQRAKSYELRATMSLARLLRDTKRDDEARTTLADIYNWFTEGFDTADLKDAKALLDELNHSPYYKSLQHGVVDAKPPMGPFAAKQAADRRRNLGPRLR